MSYLSTAATRSCLITVSANKYFNPINVYVHFLASELQALTVLCFPGPGHHRLAVDSRKKYDFKTLEGGF